MSAIERPLGDRALFRGFSCPHEGVNDELVSFLATEYARSVTELTIDAFGEHLIPHSTGLYELLAVWSSEDGGTTGGWDSSFGDAFVALQGHADARPVELATRMALHLGSRGRPGAWAASLVEPVPLRWGPWVLPPAAHLAVESDGQVARVHLGSGDNARTATFVRDGAAWHSDDGVALPAFGRRGAVVLPRRLLTLDGFPDVIEASVETPTPEMLATLGDAMDIFSEHAPVYEAWVDRVVYELFLIQPMLEHIQSGSIAKYFGVVHVSASPEATAIAELLVHEASHQYFHLLNLVDAFDDGSDSKMYYSPAVRKDRPLARIGVAFHAFANIILFYDACLESGLDDDGYCRRNREALLPQVAQLREPLDGNPALTPVGQALCYPLMERIAAATGAS